MTHLHGSLVADPGPRVGDVPDEPISATLVLRDSLGSHDATRRLVEEQGLTVDWVHGEAHTMRVTGRPADFERAFDADLGIYELPDGGHVRARRGSLHVPDEIVGDVVAVLGLDQRPIARPLYRPAAARPVSLTATEVADAYDFPASDGAQTTIAIIELGGGYQTSDLRTYFSSLGLPLPTVTSVGVQGAKNVPGKDPNGADGEVELDVEVAGAVAPGAKIAVYFAPNTTDGFLAAINAAIHAGDTDVISISWGGAESSWSASSLKAYDQAFAAARAAGIPILAASGDTGSSDSEAGVNVDFPAASPNVVGCGGTRLTLSGSMISTETVWNDNPTESAGGGGYSTHFPKPGYQPSSVGKWRGVPDVAGNADPQSGYEVVVDGQHAVIGGTSAVAPLYAGLVARLVALSGKPVGDMLTLIYATPTAFRDVTAGNNGAYRAGAGWDPASGLGSVNGTLLLSALNADGSPTPNPGPGPAPLPPTPTPVPDPTGGGDTDPFRAALDQTAPDLAAHLEAVGASKHPPLDLWHFAASRLAHLYGYPRG